MKGIKTIFILILFSCLIFGIAGACASDADGADMNATDTDDKLESIDDDQIIEKSSEDTLGDPSFSQLSYMISFPTTHSIDMASDFSYVDGDSPIVIDKDFTINGNDKTVNGEGKTIIFAIMGSYNVEICDLNIINGNNDTYSAIVVDSGSTLTLRNCTIESNTGQAGAIYNLGNLILTDCTIRNNIGDTGGAIYNHGKLTVTGSTIRNNTGNTGGAIYNSDGELKLTGTTIENNNATTAGGAIINFAKREARITNCRIMNNWAPQGGAIYNNADQRLWIADSTLKNNRAERGGAIFAIKGEVRIDNTNLIDNNAYFGGAIESYVTTYIRYSRLENNVATNFGGAVINFNTLSIQKTNFTNNAATKSGGAIYNDDESAMEITDSKLENNRAGTTGGGILNYDNCTIKNTLFNGNNAGSAGGAIHSNGTLTITLSNFTNNKAAIGGAVSSEGILKMTGSLLKNNNGGAGGAIHTNNCNATITDSPMENNNVTLSGGAMYILYSTMKIAGTQMKSNTALMGGAIYAIESTLTITDYRLKENMANTGGAIYSANANSTIALTTLENNVAEAKGGAIINAGTLIIENSAFNNNHAGLGGAIYNTDGNNSVVTGSNFTNNDAYSGGAIYNLNDLTLTNSKFITNRATAEFGGAIYNEKGMLKITGCEFERNTANKTGGAVVNLNGEFTIKNTKFEENLAPLIGAVVTDNGTSATVEEGTRFIDNSNNIYPVFANKGEVNLSNAEIITTINFEIVHIDNIMKGSGLTINVAAKMKNNNTYTGIVTVNIGGENFNVYLIKGNGTSEIHPALNSGAYTAKINFTQANYIPTTAESNEFVIMGETSFGGLDYAISKADDSIVLNDDYTFDEITDSGFKNGIVISKNLTIYGNGKTIDGKGLARVFNIDKNANVTIINLTIINGNANYGGAIYNAGNLTIIGSTLNNNSGTVDGSTGGAVHNFRGTLTVDNCQFANNWVGGMHTGGGAIANSEGTATISNSRLESNHVIGTRSGGNYGGAIYNNNGALTIENCKITNNTASGTFTTYGGAVYTNHGTLTITDSILENNQVTGSSACGGAISTINPGTNVTIKNTKISNNTVNGTYAYGGAIYNTDNFTIINSTIQNNNVTGNNGQGGAISNMNNGKLTITDSTIDSNQANTNGGAITNRGELEITSSTIKDNYAPNASSIWTTNAENVTITDTKFVDNGDNENSIYSENGEVDTTGAEFLTAPEFKIGNISDFLNGTSFTITVSEIKIGENFTGNVVVSIGFDRYPIAVVNGSGSAVVTPNAGPGKQTAKLTFEETGKYYSASAESNKFQVTIRPEIKILNIADFEEDSSVEIQISANRYFTDKVNVTISGVNYTVEVIGGLGKATITPKLQRGTYKATINYIGNENYTSDTAESNNFNVTIKSVKISSEDVSTVYNGGKYLVVTLTGIKGNAITGANVTIELSNGKKATLTTDKDGKVKFLTDNLAPNKYSVKITFAGNYTYAKATATAKITVAKATPKLTAKKKTFKRKVKTKKYAITLNTNQNKALSKVKVYIKIKGKTYTSKTNAKGKAVFKIKKLTKKGKYKAAVTFKGNAYYNKVSKKVQIVIK